MITVAGVREALPGVPNLDHVVFALRGAATYQAFQAAIAATSPAASGSSSDRASDVTGGAAGRAGRAARARDPAARLTTPAVHFLQASRPYRPLGANAMLFFDPG